MPQGKTSPMSPFVRTFRAAATANPQQDARDGGSSSSVRRKNPRPIASHSPTRMSGIKKRVKRYVPNEVRMTSAPNKPASSPYIHLPSEKRTKASASTPSASGRRVLHSETPKSL